MGRFLREWTRARGDKHRATAQRVWVQHPAWAMLGLLSEVWARLTTGGLHPRPRGLLYRSAARGGTWRLRRRGCPRWLARWQTVGYVDEVVWAEVKAWGGATH